MKRVIGVLLSICMVVSMAACSAPAESKEPQESPAAEEQKESADPQTEEQKEDSKPSAESKEKYKIGICLPPTDNSWTAKLLELLEKECENETDEFEYTIKSSLDTADQVNIMETFRQGDFDLIIVLPGDSTLMEPICEQVYDEGIATIILDRPMESDKYTAYVGGDNYATGAAAAEYLGEVLNGSGEVAVLRNWVGTPGDLLRFGGFVDTLEEKYPDIHVVREVEGENSPEAGYTATSNILTAVDDLDAIYAQVDESGLGAVQAIENAGRTDIQYVVGVGGAKECFDLMKEEGSIYTAVTTYLPTLGAEAVKQARKILRGESFERDYIDPCITVTLDNVDEYYDKGF